MRKEKVQISTLIHEESLQLIDLYAEKLDIPRSQMIRNLLNNGLSDAKVMNSLGIFDLVQVVRGAKGKKTFKPVPAA